MRFILGILVVGNVEGSFFTTLKNAVGMGYTFDPSATTAELTPVGQFACGDTCIGVTVGNEISFSGKLNSVKSIATYHTVCDANEDARLEKTNAMTKKLTEERPGLVVPVFVFSLLTQNVVAA